MVRRRPSRLFWEVLLFRPSRPTTPRLCACLTVALSFWSICIRILLPAKPRSPLAAWLMVLVETLVNTSTCTEPSPHSSEGDSSLPGCATLLNRLLNECMARERLISKVGHLHAPCALPQEPIHRLPRVGCRAIPRTAYPTLCLDLLVPGEVAQ